MKQDWKPFQPQRQRERNDKQDKTHVYLQFDTPSNTKAECPEEQGAQKGRVSQRAECPEGQSARKGRVLKAWKAEIPYDNNNNDNKTTITRFRDDE